MFFSMRKIITLTILAFLIGGCSGGQQGTGPSQDQLDFLQEEFPEEFSESQVGAEPDSLPEIPLLSAEEACRSASNFLDETNAGLERLVEAIRGEDGELAGRGLSNQRVALVELLEVNSEDGQVAQAISAYGQAYLDWVDYRIDNMEDTGKLSEEAAVQFRLLDEDLSAAGQRFGRQCVSYLD